MVTNCLAEEDLRRERERHIVEEGRSVVSRAFHHRYM